jgi:hypothetical protein
MYIYILGPWGGVAPGVVLPELVLAGGGKEGDDDDAYADKLQVSL